MQSVSSFQSHLRRVTQLSWRKASFTLPLIRHYATADARPRLSALRSILREKSDFLTDNFNRHHTYLRISLTERCNLRCMYCMPEEGVELSPSYKLLSTTEILYLSRLFVSEGVNKIRLTGGEPTVRKDIVEIVQGLGQLRADGLKKICITSNGIALERKLEKLVDAGLTHLNLSLDTLKDDKFQKITRRNGLDKVLKSLEKALALGVATKLNVVAMKDVNDDEIVDFVRMTKHMPIEVRFIEYMPFGGNNWTEAKMLPYEELLKIIRSDNILLRPYSSGSTEEDGTCKTFSISEHKGKIGFITSMTDHFCNTCNRLRITSDGNIKVCLFGNEEVSLRDIMRRTFIAGMPEDQRKKAVLDVIRAAVKQKKEKHAGMDILHTLPNRPMILIGG